MELKLLNFNRIMANISTKIVGGFVPLIVYNNVSSHKLELAILTIVLEYLLSYVFSLLLKPLLIKRPQLFLFLRIVPIIIYEILLVYVAYNPLLCVIGIGVAYSFSYTFKYVPTEVLFAYINGTKKSGTGRQLALTKILEQLSLIFGVLVGGVLLDYINIWVMIVASIVLYLGGAVPQLIYYITHLKNSRINQEFATYAHIALKESSMDKEYANKVSKKIRVVYAFFNFLQESWQSIYVMIPLFTFTLTGKFVYAAVATAIFDGVYGLGCFVAGKLNEKHDLTITASIMGCMVGISAIGMIFVSESTIWIIYILCTIIAICYSFAYFFMYDRLLKKSKIVGRNTTCIINKISMFYLSTCFVCSFGAISLPVAFVVGGGMSIMSGAIIPVVEEKTRRMLVDHLEDNEIRKQGKMFFFRRRR